MIRSLVICFIIGFALVGGAIAQEIGELPLYDPSLCAAPENAAGEPLELAIEAAESADCLAVMEAFPQPLLENIPRDIFTLSHYSFWRVGPEAVNLFDAPGGQVIGQIPAGFNFVHAIDTSVSGWLQQLGGQWLQQTDARQVNASHFTGRLLPPGWEHPFAIILDRTGIQASLRPGEPGSAESGYVTRRYRLVNIFARAEDNDGNVWYLIGPQRWIRQEYVAKFAPVERPEGLTGRWVGVDLFEQTLIAYEDDKPIFATVISSGLPDWPTEEGIFQIWARLARDSMSGATGAPDAYDLQDVPWVMYFDGGISLHGTYWHDGFGYRRSHGCVNLSISDARWLYDWTAASEPDEDGEIVNSVYVFSSGQYANE